MERSLEQVISDIEEERHYVLRHEITPRIWDRMNALLDELNLLKTMIDIEDD